MNPAVIFIIILGLFTLFWMKGWIQVGGIVSLFQKIRLAALLWAAVILVLGGLRLTGVMDGF